MGLSKGSEGQVEGSEGQPEESEGFEGQLEGSEGQPDGCEGLAEGPEGLAGDSGRGGRTYGRTDGRTDGRNFSPFYRTSSPLGAAAQKLQSQAPLMLKKMGIKRHKAS